MKIHKTIIKCIGSIILFLLIGISIYIFTSGPKLPEEAEKIIEEVISNPLPELIKGKTGFANSDGVRIWYEDIKPKHETKKVVVLIMGISADALSWPQKFIQSFTKEGYRVIRYDHRGSGLSDWLENFLIAFNPYRQ